MNANSEPRPTASSFNHPHQIMGQVNLFKGLSENEFPAIQLNNVARFMFLFLPQVCLFKHLLRHSYSETGVILFLKCRKSQTEAEVDRALLDRTRNKIQRYLR